MELKQLLNKEENKQKKDVEEENPVLNQTSSPVKYEYNLRTFAIKEASRMEEESPEHAFIHNTFYLKKLSSPMKNTDDKIENSPLFKT